MSAADGLDLTSNFAIISRQWPALSALCDDSSLFVARADAVSKWGVAQQTHHCALVLARVALGIENLMANPQAAPGTGNKHPLADALLAGGTFPRGVAKSPEPLIPPDSPQANETKTRLSEVRFAWDAIEKRGAAIAASKATFPHPLLGDFNGVQWVRFMGLHTAHHLRIIRDILAANGLPAPFDASVDSPK